MGEVRSSSLWKIQKWEKIQSMSDGPWNKLNNPEK